MVLFLLFITNRSSNSLEEARSDFLSIDPLYLGDQLSEELLKANPILLQILSERYSKWKKYYNKGM